MNRRSLMKLVSRVIGWTCALVVAVPGISFITAPLRRRSSSGGIKQRVVKLDNLRVGEPTQVAITGSRQDAWVHYDEEVVGRAWIVRETDDSVAPEETRVRAFSSVCPHLGCVVQFNSERGFNCPCHKAFFQPDGQPVSEAELGHKNPTPRSLDDLECQVVEDAESGEWWVEVKYEKFEYGLTTKVPRA
ncbi:MAG: Rieske 2Fe-2S domain-containing protein [Planctomycetaceae bacterium]|nr:Rieske 2Fe-2S domain-containing protein [Planctomycetales bacterium]MCB9873091.1 Rieske 2Fe-2S domain-containing protein [Planctomycetaceae bacterium]MCB9937771.1 Rieske 2Fe-2S domain-containing protein [Planctomycetaceae bacterium]HRX80628.1 Rieske 2Fe-2S domain-containing protein [Pirellulaceae bacterium]